MATCTVFGQRQETYQLDIENSIANWKGSYALQFSEHQGTVNFKRGELLTDNGAIIGGYFVIDMTSITNPDHLNGVGPVEHLKNEDFFDVEKFPTAHLTITSVEYWEENNLHKMIGDLTIKGQTHPVTFYAEADGTTRTLSTKLKVDRTQWGITYNNKLKDHAISDIFEVYITLQFHPIL